MSNYAGDVTPIRHILPVEAYLKPQRRFAHLFGKSADPQALAAIQRMADHNIVKFGLSG